MTSAGEASLQKEEAPQIQGSQTPLVPLAHGFRITHRGYPLFLTQVMEAAPASFNEKPLQARIKSIFLSLPSMSV